MTREDSKEGERDSLVEEQERHGDRYTERGGETEREKAERKRDHMVRDNVTERERERGESEPER